MDQGENSYRLFLQGDDDGLVQIIRDYKDGLILYLNGYVQNLTTAEDLAEETFLKLALRKPRFLANSSFRTWLYAIGRNLALDYRRHNKKREISLEDSPEAILEEMDLERAYINQEEKREVHRVMKQLKQEYREVLWLVYFEKFNYREAGRIMGRTAHSTETLAYRARRALKAKLIEEGFCYEEL